MGQIIVSQKERVIGKLIFSNYLDALPAKLLDLDQIAHGIH